jgi:hypothetical protein
MMALKRHHIIRCHVSGIEDEGIRLELPQSLEGTLAPGAFIEVVLLGSELGNKPVLVRGCIRWMDAQTVVLGWVMAT